MKEERNDDPEENNIVWKSLKILLKYKKTLNTRKINLRAKRGFPKFSLLFKKKRGQVGVLGEYTIRKKNYLPTRSCCYIIYKQIIVSQILLFINTGNKHSLQCTKIFKILTFE